MVVYLYLDVKPAAGWQWAVVPVIIYFTLNNSRIWHLGLFHLLDPVGIFNASFNLLAFLLPEQFSFVYSCHMIVPITSVIAQNSGNVIWLIVWKVCCLLAGPDSWKRMLLKFSITMVFTCLLLSWCKIWSPFRKSSNVVVFQFYFHIFMSLANLWYIRLQRCFPILGQEVTMNSTRSSVFREGRW